MPVPVPAILRRPAEAGWCVRRAAIHLRLPSARTPDGRRVDSPGGVARKVLWKGLPAATYFFQNP